MRTILLLALFAFAALVCSAQTVTIKKVQLAGDKIIVNFDLEDSNPNNNYLLNLYTSRDNFAVPVKTVTGDVGLQVKPGADKKIVWNVITDYGGYKGKLSLEIRGKVYMPFALFQSVTNKAHFKRGKSHEFKWTPGNNNPLSIELYKGGQRISGDVNQPNNGSYSLFIPAHAALGKDYKIRMYDMRSPDEVLYSEPFAVRPKIPLIVKILPIAVVGTVVAILFKPKPEPSGAEIDDPDFPNN